MKRFTEYIIFILICTGLVLMLVSCSDKKESESKDTFSSKDSSSSIESTLVPEESSTEKTVIKDDMLLLAVPGMVSVSEEAIEKINIKMKEAGIDLALFPVAVDGGTDDDFLNSIMKKEKEMGRSFDISVTGLYTSHLKSSYTVQNGCFEDLTSYLKTDRGKSLYEKFTEEEWKSTETEGKIYSVPKVNYNWNSNYVIYKNKKYISDNKSETLNELLSDFMKSTAKQDGKKILVEKGAATSIYCNGYSYMFSLCFDNQEGKYKNITKEERIIESKSMLGKLEEEGLIEYYQPGNEESFGDYYAVIGCGLDMLPLANIKK